MRSTLITALAICIKLCSTARSVAGNQDCHGKYRSCLLSGRRAGECSCDFSVCSGDEGARLRDWCLPFTGVATTTTPGALACMSAHNYAGGAECISTDGALSLVTAALSNGELFCDRAYGFTKGPQCSQGGGTVPLPPPIATGITCNPKHDTCGPVLGSLDTAVLTAFATGPTTNGSDVKMSTTTSRTSPAASIGVTRTTALLSAMLSSFACL